MWLSELGDRTKLFCLQNIFYIQKNCRMSFYNRKPAEDTPYKLEDLVGVQKFYIQLQKICPRSYIQTRHLKIICLAGHQTIADL